MPSNPYERFRGQKLTLNDYLAIDRTELANERTLLAYVRTAIALVVTGASAMKFFDAWWVTGLGAAFITAGIVAVIVGWRRFGSMNRRLSIALEEAAELKEETAKDA